MINTHAPKVINKNINKIWNDDDNRDQIRPSEIRVQLYADGKAVGESLVLNENNSWTAMWSDLAKYKDGKEILYTVEEVVVPDGYTANIEIDEDGNFILINTHISQIPDIPSEPIKPNTPDTTTPSNGIQTSDTTNLILSFVGVCISSIGIVLLTLKKRKLLKKY